MDIIRTDLPFKTDVHFPMRIILNMRTLSIYENDDISTLFLAIKLNDIKVLRKYENDKSRCFEISDSIKKAVICSLPYSTRNTAKEIEKWIIDIKDFKDKCKKPFEKKKNIMDDPDVLKAIAEVRQKKMEKTLRFGGFNDKGKKQEALSEKLKMAQIIALKTLDKELKYEERMEKEELMREEKEKEDVKNEMMCEEKKKENLLKALILKNTGKEIKEKIEMRKKLQMIQDELKEKILKNRKMFEEKLYRLRKIHERKMLKAKQHINDIRLSLTQNMIKAEKKGDMKQCKLIRNQKERDDYCNKNFIDNVYLNLDCKKETDFCTICCENEFGEMHQKEREICYAQCEIKVQFQGKKGKWVYLHDNDLKNKNQKNKKALSVKLNNNVPF